MLNFNQFRVFYYAAKHMNYTRAAAELFISQPAVTTQIKAFEDYCGFKLFKKKGRTTWLTDQGKTLYNFAQTIFSLEMEIEGVIEDMRKLKRGLLRIGTTKTYARYFMPLMLSSFHEKYPNIKIELNEGSSLEMTHSLREFKNEIAIIAKAGDVEGVRFTPFSQEEMVVIAPPGHHLASRTAIAFKELTNEEFIMKDKGSGTRKLVDDLFTQDNCNPNILMEVSNSETIKQLVQNGEGISFLVREAVKAELEDGKLIAIPLKGSKIFMDVSIAHMENHPLSPPGKAFFETLMELQMDSKMTPEGIGIYMSRILSRKKHVEKHST